MQDDTLIVIPTGALAGLSFRPERSEVEESLRSFDFAQDDTLIVIPVEVN